jgi:hypothetical protein
MATEIKKEIELEIAHVLFIDSVGYSKLSLNQQRTAIAELNEIVRGSAQFQKSEAESEVLKLATGDGMALVFPGQPAGDGPMRVSATHFRGLTTSPAPGPCFNSEGRMK